jgi:hypothetical protein
MSNVSKTIPIQVLKLERATLELDGKVCQALVARIRMDLKVGQPAFNLSQHAVSLCSGTDECIIWPVRTRADFLLMPRVQQGIPVLPQYLQTGASQLSTARRKRLVCIWRHLPVPFLSPTALEPQTPFGRLFQ